LVLVVGAEIERPKVYRITVIQLGVLVPSCVLLLAIDRVWAWSVLSGGLIEVLPQAYFTVRVFRWRGAQSARAVANSSYAGLVGKFIFSAAGFAAVFALLRPVDGLAVFAGFLAMLMIQIIASWLLLSDN
jgi:ATP synthase protein I